MDCIEILAEPNIKKFYENFVIIKIIIQTKFEKKELFEFVLSNNTAEESLKELLDRDLNNIIDSEFDIFEFEEWEFDDIFEKAYDASKIYDVLKIVWIDPSQLCLFGNHNDITLQSTYERLNKKYDSN